MRIAFPVLMAVFVVLAMSVTGTVGTGTLTTSSGPTAITACTTITEPGEYVVTRDIDTRTSDSRSPCIRIQASNVVVDGQGHGFSPVSPHRPTISVGVDDRRLSNVTVRNVEISSSPEDNAIEYESVDGGTVANVTLSSNGAGVFLGDSTDVTVRGSTIEGQGGLQTTTSPSRYGVLIENTTDAVIRGNTLRRFTRGTSIQVDDGSSNTTIANNRVRGCVECDDDTDYDGNPRYNTFGRGIEIYGAVGTTVVNNTIENLTDGVALHDGAVDTVIAHNDISRTTAGIRVVVAGSPTADSANETTVVHHNTLTASNIAVDVGVIHGKLAIRHNELVGNDYGVRASDVDLCPPGGEGTENVDVRHNAIVNTSEYGILNERSVTLNATRNYWGASGGPSSANDSDAPFEDPATGALADGEGAVVSEHPDDSGVSNVRFDPWLNQSVGNATEEGTS